MGKKAKAKSVATNGSSSNGSVHQAPSRIDDTSDDEHDISIEEDDNMSIGSDHTANKSSSISLENQSYAGNGIAEGSVYSAGSVAGSSHLQANQLTIMPNSFDDASRHTREFAEINNSLTRLFHEVSLSAQSAQQSADSTRRELNYWRESFLRVSSEKDQHQIALANAETERNHLRRLHQQRAQEDASGGSSSTAVVEINTLRKRIKVLERDLSTAKSKTSKAPASIGNLVAIVIDGDGHIFNEKLLREGFGGGARAASELRVHVQNLSDALVGDDGNKSTIICQIFMNKDGLSHVLHKALGISPDTFNDFLFGFNAAHELFTAVDVGSGKESADAKVREHLRLYTRMDAVRLVAFGGAHDNGYSRTLSSLATDGLLDKVQLIRSYEDLAKELQQFSDRSFTIPNLFLSQKLDLHAMNWSSVSKHVNHRSTGGSGSGSGGGGGGAGGSPKFSSANLYAPDKHSGGSPPRARAENVTIPASKTSIVANRDGDLPSNVPVNLVSKRPCHIHCLSPPCLRPDCAYGHYGLTFAQRSELRRLAKEVPCGAIIDGSECPFADRNCIYGHGCPHKSKCTFRDKCRFYINGKHIIDPNSK